MPNSMRAPLVCKVESVAQRLYLRCLHMTSHALDIADVMLCMYIILI